MDKNDAFVALQEPYKVLTEKEKGEFSRVCNRLLHETFLIKGIKEDKADYFYAIENRHLLKDFFALLDYDVVYDEVKAMVYIKTNGDYNRVILRKFETVLLIVFRRFYYNKSKEVSASDRVMVSLQEVIDEVRAARVYRDDKGIDTYKKSLSYLRQLKIIDYSGSNIDSMMQVEILPTILVVLPLPTIEEINNKLQDYAVVEKGEEDENNN